VGHTVATVLDGGAVKSSSFYEAFGNVVVSSGASENNRLANTKERDASIGLDNHGFRYYDSAVGRYSTGDPFRYVDGMNVYVYTYGNPINHVDPQGLEGHDDKNAVMTDARAEGGESKPQAESDPDPEPEPEPKNPGSVASFNSQYKHWVESQEDITEEQLAIVYAELDAKRQAARKAEAKAKREREARERDRLWQKYFGCTAKEAAELHGLVYEKTKEGIKVYFIEVGEGLVWELAGGMVFGCLDDALRYADDVAKYSRRARTGVPPRTGGGGTTSVFPHNPKKFKPKGLMRVKGKGGKYTWREFKGLDRSGKPVYGKRIYEYHPGHPHNPSAGIPRAPLRERAHYHRNMPIGPKNRHIRHHVSPPKGGDPHLPPGSPVF
jgi:RHS repeat-associated protein